MTGEYQRKNWETLAKVMAEAMTAEDWKKAVRTLSRAARSGDAESARVLANMRFQAELLLRVDALERKLGINQEENP